MIQPILATFYKFKASEICELRSVNKSSYHAIDKLPQYGINPEHNNVIGTDYFFQFFDKNLVDQMNNPDEEFVLFDVETSGILAEEESNIGFTDLFGESKEFSLVLPFVDDWGNYKSYLRSIPWITTILVDCQYYGDGYDVEFECSIFGILTSDGKIIQV